MSLTNEERKKVLDLTIRAGAILLQNGAEVFRAEQTMTHIADGFALNDFNVYVLTNGIFASAGTLQQAKVANIPKRTVHLGRVASVNALSREIAEGNISIKEAENKLEQISKQPFCSNTVRIIASSLGSLFFCGLYGGGLWECLVAAIAGLILGIYLIFCEKRSMATLFNTLSGALVVSIVCMFIALFMPKLQANQAIIGAYMLLTPGVALTMSIRDLMHSDYLSGLIRLLDALLVAAAIAAGTGLAVIIEKVIGV